MAITRAQFPLLLEPKLSAIWYDAYPQWAVEYTAFCNMRSTKKATVTDYNMTDFGPLRLKGEGESIIYDDPINGNTKTYQPVRFALGYKVPQEMQDHELYGQIEKLERGLMKSAIYLQEVTAHLLLNNGFGTTNADGFTAAGFDGLALFSTAHTRLDGGATQRNRPSTDINLTHTGVQNALIDYDNWVDHRGRPAMVRARRLIVTPQDRFTAKEILQSEYKPGVANNEINSLQGEGLSFMVDHYLTDTNAWFLFSDQHDCNFIWDVRPRLALFDGGDEGFDKEILKRKVVEGFIVGHGEWMGTWGTSGAS